jgi:hypothetical protein
MTKEHKRPDGTSEKGPGGVEKRCQVVEIVVEINNDNNNLNITSTNSLENYHKGFSATIRKHPLMRRNETIQYEHK